MKLADLAFEHLQQHDRPRSASDVGARRRVVRARRLLRGRHSFVLARALRPNWCRRVHRAPALADVGGQELEGPPVISDPRFAIRFVWPYMPRAAPRAAPRGMCGTSIRRASVSRTR